MNFEADVLVINTKDGNGGVIQNPQFHELEGRRFICGTSTLLDDEGPKWTAGLRMWIAIDSITTITEVPSVEEYVRRCQLHRNNEDENFRRMLDRRSNM